MWIEVPLMAGIFLGVLLSSVAMDDGFFGGVMPALAGVVGLYWLSVAMLAFVVAPSLLRLSPA